MQSNPTSVPVVAGLILGRDGRLLLRKRPPGKPHAGQWEFPGGKVERDENQRVALSRELGEELGVEVDPVDFEPVTFAENLPENPVVLFLYKVSIWEGDPQPLEGAELAWFKPEEVKMLDLPDLDRQLWQRAEPLG